MRARLADSAARVAIAMSDRVLSAMVMLSAAAAAATLPTEGGAQRRGGDKPIVRLWDTAKAYVQKNPMSAAWKDRAHWTQVPHGTTDTRARGDLMIENDYFYLFLFTNKDDSVDLMAKLSTGGYKPNEIYKVHDTGARNFGHGTMWTLILKNTPDGVTVMHAGEGRRHGKPEPVITTYRVRAGRPWREVRPVQRVNQQGMHGKSRICALLRRRDDRRGGLLGAARRAQLDRRFRQRLAGVPADPAVGVLRVDGLDGRPIAILVNYASHPTILEDVLFSVEK